MWFRVYGSRNHTPKVLGVPFGMGFSGSQTPTTFSLPPSGLPSDSAPSCPAKTFDESWPREDVSTPVRTEERRRSQKL